ncbi:MAG: glycosyltransferase [Geminicoccaceae bacterium]
MSADRSATSGETTAFAELSRPSGSERSDLSRRPKLEGWERVTIVCFGFGANRIRKQPWFQVDGIARGLAAAGAEVLVLSDVDAPVIGAPYGQKSTARLFDDRDLGRHLDGFDPDQVLIVGGAQDLFRMSRMNWPVAPWLVLASQRWRLREWLRLPLNRVWREAPGLVLAFIQTLLPGLLLRYAPARHRIAGIIYVSRAARRRWSRAGLPGGPVVPPLVRAWLSEPARGREPAVGYFGPPLAVRGADLVIDAFEQMVETGVGGKLILALRADGVAELRAARRLEQRARESRFADRITTVVGHLERSRLASLLSPCQIMLLPFRLTISDAPLVSLEAAASGRRVVSLDTPGVAEFVRAGGGVVVGQPRDLAKGLSEAWRLGSRRPAPVPGDWCEHITGALASEQTALGRFDLIGLSGVDGTGKSTLLRTLQQRLQDQDVQAQIVWTRFRNYLSKPLLGLTRLTGHNRRIERAEGTVRLHRFREPALLARSFLAAQWLDSAIDSLVRYRVGRVGLVLGDRSVVDTLVDLAVDTGREDIVFGWYGRSLMAMLPRRRRILVLDRSPRSVLADRPDVAADPDFMARFRLYRLAARRLGLPIIANDGEPTEALGRIVEICRQPVSSSP